MEPIISRTKTERVRHEDNVWRSSFLSSFMDTLCHVKKNNNVCTLVTNCLCVHSSVILVFISHNKKQNNPLVSTETVRHSSTYIILYFFLVRLAKWLFQQQWLQSYIYTCNEFSSIWCITQSSGFPSHIWLLFYTSAFCAMSTFNWTDLKLHTPFLNGVENIWLMCRACLIFG